MKLKKYVISIFAAIAVLGIILYINPLKLFKNDSGKASAASSAPYQVYDASGKVNIPAGGTTAADMKYRLNNATKDNPFVLLEIVPDLSMAELGYMVKGFEPIDIDRMEYIPSSSAGTGQNINLNPTNLITSTYGLVKAYEPNADEIAAGQWSLYDWETQKRYITYTRVADNTGNYVIKLENAVFARETANEGSYKLASAYAGTEDADIRAEMLEYAGEGNGDFTVTSITKASFVKVADGTGNYKRTYADEFVVSREDRPFDVSTELCVDVNGSVNVTEDWHPYGSYRNTFTNKNEFLRRCLNFDADKIKEYNDNEAIIVITLTPNELNNNLDIIDRADLISISKGYKMGSVFKDYWNTYRRENLFPASAVAASGNKYTDFSTNDLSWSAVMKLFEKCGTSIDSCPLLFDVTVYTNAPNKKRVTANYNFGDGSNYSININGTKNNMAKLYLMLEAMEPTFFASMYGSAITESGGTGYFNQFSGDAAIYWGTETFYPLKLYRNYEEFAEDQGTNKLNSFDILTNYSDALNTSVRHNTYTYNGNNALNMSFAAENIGYKDDYTDLEAFTDSYDKKADGSDKGKGDRISSGEVVYYLLNADKPDYYDRYGDISILEIQPCAIFHVPGYWEAYIRSKFKYYTGTVIVEQQNSSEYIGRVEDEIETYDIIYIGTYTGMNDDTRKIGSNTYAYIHTGAKVTKKLANNNNSFGILGETTYKYQDVYYSGNDFTKNKYEKLRTYARAGKLILFDDEFYSGSSINKNKIDTASYVYKLTDTLKPKSRGAAGTYPAAYLLNEAGLYELRSALDATRCHIGVISKPVEYDSNENPIQYNGSIFEYVIKINGKSGSKYTVNMYADMNADGQYSPLNERFDFTSLTDSHGNNVASNNLVSGEAYTLKVNITDRVGIFPWKVEIIERNGAGTPTGIKDSILGMSAIQAAAKEEIKVLQITADKTNDDGSEKNPAAWNNVTLPNAEEIAAYEAAYAGTVRNGMSVAELDAIAGPLDSSDSKDDVTKMFWLYTRDLSEFSVDTVRMSGKDFNQYVADSMAALTDSDAGGDASLARPENRSKLIKKLMNEVLGNYDMVIVGFADDYMDGFSSAESLEVIDAYIKSGAAILFTHDTTTFCFDDGYGLKRRSWVQTVYFRDVLGLDRYGASLKYNVDINDISLGNKIDNLRVKDKRISVSDLINVYNKDGIYLANGSQSTGNLAKASDGVVQLQGYTNGLIKRNGGNIDGTTEVSRVNQGQITNYPYKIGENIPVARTHSQYYQTSLEPDDKGNQVVVWYTLSGNANTSAKEPHDVRNYYYIYNYANVTYSGVGHSGNLTLDEVKLFVNTIIAAYRANASNPTARIENDGAVNIGSESFAYVPYDATNVSQAVGNDIIIEDRNSDGKEETYLRMYFSIRNGAIVVGKRFILEFSAEDDEHFRAYFNGVQPVIRRKSDDKIAVETDTIAGYNPATHCIYEDMAVSSGIDADERTYYFDICINDGEERVTEAAKDSSIYLSERDEQKFRINVKMYYVGLDREYAKESDQNVTLLRRGLFNLD